MIEVQIRHVVRAEDGGGRVAWKRVIGYPDELFEDEPVREMLASYVFREIAAHIEEAPRP